MAILTIGLSCYDQFFYIDNFIEEDQKTFATKLLESGGGPCGNAAYLLGLWGVDEIYHVCSLKNDIYGKKLIKELQTVNVNVDYSIVNENQITALSSILINKNNASRTIITHKKQYDSVISINDKLRIDKLINQLNSVDCTHVILVDGHEKELSEYIIDALQNKIVVQDAGNVRESNLALMKKTDYLISSEKFAKDLLLTLSPSTHQDIENFHKQWETEKELEIFSESSLIKQALCLMIEKSQPHTIPVITLGKYGAVTLSTNDEIKKTVFIPAYQCLQIDTTGAGDIYHGAFCYALSHQWSLDQSLDFAALTSAISIEKQGVRNAMPSFVEVESARINHMYQKR
ncbi:kinase [Lonepinella koalarum]|uniref:carbohydrate kinase family protein n=1 Tax=Lonepinella koalarum TaxID=53417 RepID=UPI0011E42769|nr:PfkB family carbohydrate kinase [Lonepinella koalarum]TYG34990.1 kinase [Lonepinella koalarum]